MGQEDKQGRADNDARVMSSKQVVEYVWAHTRTLKAQVEEQTRWTALSQEQRVAAMQALTEGGVVRGSVKQ